MSIPAIDSIAHGLEKAARKKMVEIRFAEFEERVMTIGKASALLKETGIEILERNRTPLDQQKNFFKQFLGPSANMSKHMHGYYFESLQELK